MSPRPPGRFAYIRQHGAATSLLLAAPGAKWMQRRARPWGHRCMARWTGAILGSSLGSSWGVQGPYHTNPSLVPFRQWDRHRICHRIAMDHSFPRTVPPSDPNRNRRPPTTTTPHSASRIAPPTTKPPPVSAANHRHSATSPALPTFFLPPAHLEREWVSTIFVRPDGDWGRERERRCLVCCCGA